MVAVIKEIMKYSNKKIMVLIFILNSLLNCWNPSARAACNTRKNVSKGNYIVELSIYLQRLELEKQGVDSNANYYLYRALLAYENEKLCQKKTDKFPVDPFN